MTSITVLPNSITFQAWKMKTSFPNFFMTKISPGRKNPVMSSLSKFPFWRSWVNSRCCCNETPPTTERILDFLPAQHPGSQLSCLQEKLGHAIRPQNLTLCNQCVIVILKCGHRYHTAYTRVFLQANSFV